MYQLLRDGSKNNTKRLSSSEYMINVVPEESYTKDRDK